MNKQTDFDDTLQEGPTDGEYTAQSFADYVRRTDIELNKLNSQLDILQHEISDANLRSDFDSNPFHLIDYIRQCIRDRAELLEMKSKLHQFIQQNNVYLWDGKTVFESTLLDYFSQVKELDRLKTENIKMKIELRRLKRIESENE